MSVRWKKVLRDILSSKTRTALVVVSIAIGVFAVGAIVSTQTTLTRLMEEQFLAVKPSSLIITTSDFDPDLLESVRRIPGVAQAEARRLAPVQLEVGPDEFKSLQLITVPDYEDQRLDIIRPQTGNWPPAFREVLIERASVPLVTQPEGSVLTVQNAQRRPRELTFAGTTHDLNQLPAAFSGSPYGYVTDETMEWLGYPRQFNEIHVRTTQPQDRAFNREVANEIEARLARGNILTLFTWLPEPDRHPADSFIQPLLLILGVMGFLSLVLSGFLVVNTITAILAQQTRQIGVMKAIGARTGQVAGLYFFMVLVYGALALALAVPLGAVAAFGFTTLLTGFLNFDSVGIQFPPEALIIQAVVALAVPLLASLVPILGGARVSVREAIDSTGGAGGFGGNVIDRAVESIRGMSRPMLLSIRNTVRRKARLILTLTTLTLGGAIFVSVLTVYSSLIQSLDDALAFWDYDVQVQMTRPYRTDQLIGSIERVPGVTGAESWSFTSARLVRQDGTETEPFFLFGPPNGSKLVNPTIVAGRWLLPEDESAVVLNTDLTKDNPWIEPGTTVQVKVGNRDLELQVVGIAQSALFGALGLANEEYLSQALETSGRTPLALVQTEQRTAAFQDRVAKDIRSVLDEDGMTVATTQTIESAREIIVNSFTVLVVFLSVMAVLVAVVGGLGLAGTMSINVLERSREIGVMRAIGANDGAIMRIVLVEGALIGAMSWALGLVLSVPISLALTTAVGNAFLQAPLPFVFSWNGAALWLGIVVVLALVASFLPALRASRVTVREVLAYE